MSVSVAVNETVNFTCTAIADIIDVRVNGIPVADGSASIVLNATQNLRTRTVSVFGSVENNGSSITCVAFSITPFSVHVATSEPAVLLVLESGIL